MAQESVLRVVIDSRNAERNARNVARELQNIERNGDYASRSMDSMSVATRQLAGYMAGIVTVGAAISKMDAYTGLQNRLKLVTDSQAELNTAMNDTFAIAQKTASSWDSTAMVYQRFADNADRLGISMKQTAALTETVSKAISVSGGSAASAEAALMQFGQALASGVLRGEEFNSIAEQAPGLLKAIAMGMDTNVGSLRAMAAEGKITGDELVKALSKAKPYIDDLFNKTDFTIAQSFTQLSNEITKFVGAAGAGSGAAAGLSAAISGLANNLSTIANIAVIGGVALLTKTIAAQTVAIYGSITGVMARRAADLAALESQAQLAGLEVQRTRQVAALALTEVHLARQELNSATTRTARAAATVRLTQAEVALAIAEKQKTAATIADTAAQNANNAARSRGAALFAMVGGWTGVLTVGVTALAAGYMYLKSRTAEANAKLEEQGKIAQETDAELRKLSGNDKISAVRDLTAAFNAQNETLVKSKESVDAVLFSIRAVSVENEAARKVTEDARNGVISYDEAIKRLNQMDIPTDLYDQLKKQVFQYNENAEKAGESQRALSALGKVVKLAGNLFQNAAVQVAKNTDELNKNETAAQKAAKAQKGYFDSLNQDVLGANERLAYMNLGFSKEVIDQINKLQEAKQKALGDSVTAIVTTEEINKIVQAQKALDAVKNKEDEIAEAKRKQNKESEKRYQYTQSELKMLQKVAALSAKHDLDGIGAKYGIPKNYLAGLMAQESKGNPNAVSPTGAIGYFQTTSAYRKDNGLSVADSKNLPVIAEVVAKNLAKAYEELGGWEAAIRSHNAGLAGSAKFAKSGKVNGSAARNKEVANFAPAVNKWIVGLGGSALKNKGAADAIDDLKQYSEFLKEQAELRKNLEFNIASEVKQIRSRLAEDLEEIDKAGYSPERAKELKAEYQARADNDIAIAQQALKTKLDDYAAFKKTESQLLEDSFNEQKFYASRDLELTKEQRDKAVALLDEQLKQEQALLMLAYETRIFQYKEALMAEAEFVRERYRIEMLELSKIVDIEERRIAMQAKTTAFIRGSLAPVGTPLVESDKGKSNTQLLQEETGRELLAMQNRHLAAQVAAKDNANELLRIDKEYLAAKEQLHAEHDIKLVDARQADFENQLQVYSQIAGMTAQTFDQMAGMLRDSAGESNALYKTMFLAGKAASIAQAIVNTEEGATKALAQGGAYGSILAGVVRATGYASVGMIAAQTIAGFATGGKIRGAGTPTSDSIPILASDREYMVRAYAAEKLGTPTMDYINKYGELPQNTHRVGMGAVSAINSGGATVVQPKVVINNYSSEKVETSTNQDGELMVTIGKMLDQKIDTGVDRGIQRNLRQGHPLANAIKGR